MAAGAVDNAAMPKTFRPYEPDQMLLMPPSLADWVPAIISPGS